MRKNKVQKYGFYICTSGRSQKLKYCSKCGNELLDEAVICPKCGCAAGGADQVPDKLIADKRRSHLSAGLILNNIAAIGNAVIAAVFTYLLFFDKGEPGSGPVSAWQIFSCVSVEQADRCAGAGCRYYGGRCTFVFIPAGAGKTAWPSITKPGRERSRPGLFLPAGWANCRANN